MTKPLREVVKRAPARFWTDETLSCGHVLRIKGTPSESTMKAKRRFCPWCGVGAPGTPQPGG